MMKTKKMKIKMTARLLWLNNFGRDDTVVAAVG